MVNLNKSVKEREALIRCELRGIYHLPYLERRVSKARKLKDICKRDRRSASK